MRLLRCSLLFISTIILSFFVLSFASAQVVTFDVAGKKAASDTEKINPVGPRLQKDQAGVFIQSTILTPQKFTLKYTGLSAQSYDVYVNFQYLSSKSKSELEQGIELKLEGTVVNQDLMRCVKALDGKIEAAYKPWQGRLGELGRVVSTLSQAAESARTGVRREQAYRSVGVIIAPAGNELKPMSWITQSDAQGTKDTVKDCCDKLQAMRSKMYSAIKDPLIRNWAVATMTPVDFSAILSTKNGKPHIDATVLNNCDLPISGSVIVKLPSGWKSNAKNLAFKDLKSGKTFNLSFDLIPPAGESAVPEKVPMVAHVAVKRDLSIAKCNFETSAKAAVEVAH